VSGARRGDAGLVRSRSAIINSRWLIGNPWAGPGSPAQELARRVEEPGEGIEIAANERGTTHMPSRSANSASPRGASATKAVTIEIGPRPETG
jgi:hypothetical protein